MVNDFKKNNFDFLRLLFAYFVLITHSYPLSGATEQDALYTLTKGQLSFSSCGVYGFFVLSGYLVSQSLNRSTSLLQFFWKRVLRIFPALFVVLLLTVVLAPFVYQLNKPYWQNASVYSYVWSNLSLYQPQLSISGVFENNVYKNTINGSLWTIPYEFTMYIILSILFFCKKYKKLILLFVVMSLMILYIGNIFFHTQLSKYNFNLNAESFFNYAGYFVAGVFLSVIQIEKSNQKLFILIAFIILFIIALLLQMNEYVIYILYPVMIILIGLHCNSLLHRFTNAIGDISYGVYIYAFPVQQTLMYFFKCNTFFLMLFSAIITTLFAYASWHIIEKRAIKLKNKILVLN